MYKVPKHVSRLQNLSKENIENYEDYEKNLDKKGIKSFFGNPIAPKKQETTNTQNIKEIPDNFIVSNDQSKQKSKKLVKQNNFFGLK